MLKHSTYQLGIGVLLVSFMFGVLPLWFHHTVKSPVSVLSSTVLLVGPDSQGSGFAIEPNLIATAGHIVDIDVDYVEALDGTWHRVVASWRDNEYDVGFLRVVGVFPVLEFGNMPEVLDRVYLLSCIHGEEYSNSITVGWISYMSRSVSRWDGVVQVDVVGGPGSSGGVLVNDRLKVVGMCVAGDTSVPGVVFFEPVEHILEAYEEYKNGTWVEESCEEEVSVGRR